MNSPPKPMQSIAAEYLKGTGIDSHDADIALGAEGVEACYARHSAWVSEQLQREEEVEMEKPEQTPSPNAVTAVSRDVPKRDPELGENPLPSVILAAYPRIAEWSADKSADHIRETVNHWSKTLHGIDYEKLGLKHERSAVFSKMNERLKEGCSIDGANIHIGNIFGRN